MRIGIPKELLAEEKRVAATPETVRKYVDMGFDVAVEASAGEGIQITNDDYQNAGAKILSDVETLFAESDIILKVKQPVLYEKAGRHEVNMLRDGSILVTFLHPAAPENHDMIKRLRDKNITAFTMDGIPRISRAQRMDATPMKRSKDGSLTASLVLEQGRDYQFRYLFDNQNWSNDPEADSLADTPYDNAKNSVIVI